MSFSTVRMKLSLLETIVLGVVDAVEEAGEPTVPWHFIPVRSARILLILLRTCRLLT